MEVRNLDDAIEALMEELTKTEDYIEYKKCYEAIKDDYEAGKKVERIRELHMKVQGMSEDEYNRESENIYNEVDALCEDKKVVAFIEAETVFSKLYQRITERIISSLED